ncbi:MFS transporter [Solicola sp. PLA-1-18]|uniref:MFS transporter n=1 Tax=Solicola sp. PLA-1-18 TaxID=3380532 RepID=UPI003B827EF1
MSTSPGDAVRARSRSPRVLLALAAVAVAFAAADTYVVVLALPDMMTSAGLDLDQLQRAAPIVSGFLLGYVGVLPLIGRIADLRGRAPVLLASLVVFAIGSVLTAVAYDLDTMVVGRFVQGVGGGGLVPATLALVADLWPPERRGLPLGVVGAVQELGSVVGPLYGALVLAVADWRAIFWLNCAVGLVLVAALLAVRPDEGGAAPARSRGRPDGLGALLLVAALACVAVLELEPTGLVTDITWGLAFLPTVGDTRWTSPLAIAVVVVLGLFVLRQATARRPLLDWRSWGPVVRTTDLLGALLLAVALGAVVVAFASADPEQSALSPQAPWLLSVAALSAVGFAWRQRAARFPLVPRDALRARRAWGSIVVSFLIGSALIAALVDIPFFARITVYRDSQLDAALVLLRFLVALPVGAVVGGWLTRRVRPGPLTAVAMLAVAVSFVAMATWDRDALLSWTSTVPLVVAGLGFGVAIAPVNAALLASTRREAHGVASALLVVARMVGMLVGISALTTIGLQRFYVATREIPPVAELCPGGTTCGAYRDALVDAGVVQLSAVFTGAAVCAALAAVLALVLLRPGRGDDADS